MVGNILEHCKTETLSSKSRARTQEKGARIDRLDETEVSRLRRIKRARWDSNPRPDAPQASALSKLCNGSEETFSLPVIIHFKFQKSTILLALPFWQRYSSLSIQQLQ